MPRDHHEVINGEDIQKTINKYQDVIKNEVNLRGHIPVEIKHENNTQRMQILIIERKI